MSKEGLNFSVTEFPICKSFRTVPNLATADEMLLISRNMSGIHEFRVYPFWRKKGFAFPTTKRFTHD